MRQTHLGALAMAIGTFLLSSSASAFCGFYVGGSDASLTNNATMVVLMREGTRTVLSMQNDYEGPPEGFALVVPVPEVIEEENVRTLPGEVFARVDRLASPRLVEYWEQDPCGPPWMDPSTRMARSMRRARPAAGSGGGPDLGVTIEAQFEVGEYDIVILSATDSDGLETWLQQEDYNIPTGASAVLRPYIEAGTKFFVARVNIDRVTFEDGRVLLSPLRVHYTADTFTLPVRLGLLNSPGTQDLIVHVLARNQRYELANYENVTIPTNLDVANEVRERFGEFYATLFDATVERNPGAVVTEYAWQATNCDPCPGPVMTPQDLMTLGADVAGGPGHGSNMSFVLTRLHHRYNADGLDEDLVFRAADPIVGGREFLNGETLEHGARPASANNFQGRYSIRHPWEGAIECENPTRGQWGPPPQPGGVRQGPGETTAAQNTAFAPRGNMELRPMLRTSAPEIAVEAGLASIADVLSGAAQMETQAQAPGVEADEEPSEAEGDETPTEDEETPEDEAPEAGGCGSCATRSGSVSLPALGIALTLLAFIRLRR